MYRKDEHAGALTRGGKFRCCGRVVCCTIMLVVLIIVGIVAAFFRTFAPLSSEIELAGRIELIRRATSRTVWIKPPDVSFNGIEPPSNGQEVSVVGSGFNINVRLNVRSLPLSLARSVLHIHFSMSQTDRSNQSQLYVLRSSFLPSDLLEKTRDLPHQFDRFTVFGASFDKISATAYYPTKPDDAIGGGTLDDVEIPKNSKCASLLLYFLIPFGSSRSQSTPGSSQEGFPRRAVTNAASFPCR